MAVALSISIYASLGLFVWGCARRIHQYTRLPMHLRWELYPVPHEIPARAAYGGSSFEQSDLRNVSKHHWGTLRAMSAEILLFETLWRFQRRLWWRSLLLHLGFYCVVLAVLGWTLSALFSASAIDSIAHWVAAVGFALVLCGASVLLVERCSSRALRNFTHSGHVLQLALLIVTAALLLDATLTSSAPRITATASALLAFRNTPALPTIASIAVLVACALIAYIPFSPMAHFIGKYFSYHRVRWDDQANRGGKFDAAIERNLRYQPSWSAAHFDRDKRKTWAEIAGDHGAQK